MVVLSNFHDRVADGRITPLYVALVVILVIMLSGALPAVLFILSRNALWIVWGLLLLSVFVLGLQLGLQHLIKPALPFITWMLLYVAWGTLAAAYPIIPSGGRLLFRSLCVVTAVSIVTSHRNRLRLFANGAQVGLVLNLIVTTWLISHPEFQQHPIFSRMSGTFDSDRFAGLWADANMAGAVSLFIMALSHWATPLFAWAGRISGLIIIYLAASRTAFWIAMMLLVFRFLLSGSRLGKLRPLLVAVAMVLVVLGVLGTSRLVSLPFIKENPTLSRVFDISESKTRERGDASRTDLGKEWLRYAKQGPWYGHGLYSCEGDASQETNLKRGFPTQGTHNLLMALFIDTGWVGLSLFLLVIGIQLFRNWRASLPPPSRRMVFAICFIILVFSMTSHQMVTDFMGWIAYSLIFLLASSPALQEPLAT